jgi:hypothetical protein
MHHNLQDCSVAPQSSTLPRAAINTESWTKNILHLFAQIGEPVYSGQEHLAMSY